MNYMFLSGQQKRNDQRPVLLSGSQYLQGNAPGMMNTLPFRGPVTNQNKPFAAAQRNTSESNVSVSMHPGGWNASQHTNTGFQSVTSFKPASGAGSQQQSHFNIGVRYQASQVELSQPSQSFDEIRPISAPSMHQRPATSADVQQRQQATQAIRPITSMSNAQLVPRGGREMMVATILPLQRQAMPAPNLGPAGTSRPLSAPTQPKQQPSISAASTQEPGPSLAQQVYHTEYINKQQQARFVVVAKSALHRFCCCVHSAYALSVLMHG